MNKFLNSSLLILIISSSLHAVLDPHLSSKKIGYDPISLPGVKMTLEKVWVKDIDQNLRTGKENAECQFAWVTQREAERGCRDYDVQCWKSADECEETLIRDGYKSVPGSQVLFQRNMPYIGVDVPIYYP